jgi:hypothetical protein
MSAAYLGKLNAEQRRAVIHGSTSLSEASPLLIIAGAGSGLRTGGFEMAAKAASCRSCWPVRIRSALRRDLAGAQHG